MRKNGQNVSRLVEKFCVWRIERMSMSEVINSIEREMFDVATRENSDCKNKNKAIYRGLKGKEKKNTDLSEKLENEMEVSD